MWDRSQHSSGRWKPWVRWEPGCRKEGVVVRGGFLREGRLRLGQRMEVTILGCRLGKWLNLSVPWFLHL